MEWGGVGLSRVGWVGVGVTDLLRRRCTHWSSVISTKQCARMRGIDGQVAASAARITSLNSAAVGF